MKKSLKLTLALAASAGIVLGCSSPPSQKPRILGSRSPGGAPPAPPIGSSRPVHVPMAPVGPPGGAIAPAGALIPTPAPVTVQQTPYVPLQPGAAPLNSAQPQLQPLGSAATQGGAVETQDGNLIMQRQAPP